jgi:hypothetical protein
VIGDRDLIESNSQASRVSVPEGRVNRYAEPGTAAEEGMNEKRGMSLSIGSFEFQRAIGSVVLGFEVGNLRWVRGAVKDHVRVGVSISMLICLAH